MPDETPTETLRRLVAEYPDMLTDPRGDMPSKSDLPACRALERARLIEDISIGVYVVTNKGRLYLAEPVPTT